MTHILGKHTIKFGGYFEYSGENDADQINVAGTPGGTNNQNGRFVFTNTTPGGTLTAITNAAIGLFDTYAEIGPRFRYLRRNRTPFHYALSWAHVRMVCSGFLEGDSQPDV